MELDPEIPIALLLDRLSGDPGWQLIRQRLEQEEARRIHELINMPADADAREVQRQVGFIEGLRHVLGESDRTVKKWKQNLKATNTGMRAGR